VNKRDIMVDIGVTFKCNNNCIMCTEAASLRSEEPPLNQIISQITTLKNPDYILLTGGEPTLRKDIFFILNYINKKFPRTEIKLITNGRLFRYNIFVDKIKKIKNLLIISEIHGDERLHNKITRTKGSFKQTQEGIKNILRNNIDLEMRLVIHKLNYQSILWIANYISTLKSIKQAVIFPIDIIGKAYKNRKKLVITYKEIMPYVEEGIKIFQNNNIKVRLYHFPLCILKPQYRKIAEKVTVTETRVTFIEECYKCIYYNKCPRVWKTYAKLCGTEEFKAIENEI